MSFDALTLACIADELRGTIKGGRVQEALLPNKLAVGLEIYANHERHYLFGSVHAERGRVHLASEKLRRGVDKETGLLLLLRKYVRGAIVSEVSQPAFERILHVEFDHPEWGCSELIFEIMGRHSNIILVGAGGRVLDAVKRVGTKRSSTRPILPGQSYMAPPPQAKLAPPDLTEFRLQQLLAEHQPKKQVWQALVDGLRGMSPLLAREIVFRALGQSRATIGQVEYLTPLLEAIRLLLGPIESGNWQPTVVWREDGPAVYASYPVTHQGEPQPMASMSSAIEVYADTLVGSDPYAAARRPVQQAIASARGRLERRQKAIESSLKEAGEADQWRQRGEWILAYAHTIVPGQEELLAETEDSEIMCISLDPDKSPAENAQGYFARYRKALRAGEGSPARIEEIGLALRDLEQLETDLELAANRPEIDLVRAALIEAGHLRPGKDKLPKAGRSHPLSLTSPDGLDILVGLNSRQNDEVTFRQAKGDDWWFHARGVPGAHVIVRFQGTELPPDTIRRAAELAAYYSRSRDEVDVLVDYTRRRYVRRIPGAAPGLVTYRQEQSIRIIPRGPS
jgi:predicted ribosome quality control (RQC) complex YloA/Tae2 family protein